MKFSPQEVTDPASFFQRSYEQSIHLFRSGAQRSEVLAFLTNAAETAAGPGTASSILLLDRSGLLRNGASPKLPPDHLKAIDGLKPDARVGTCAAVAATGRMVVTPDFRADDKWAELRHLPLALGYVGAWSVPIKDRKGRVLGTFGTYLREQRPVNQQEIKGVELLASAAAIIVTYDQASQD